MVDAAKNDLMRPALYDAYHHVEAVGPTGNGMTAHIVGPICESGGTFAMARNMDAVYEGQLVIFRTAGANGAALSSRYNSRPITPEVLVDGDRWALVRRRLDLADAVSIPLPEWLQDWRMGHASALPRLAIRSPMNVKPKKRRSW